MIDALACCTMSAWLLLLLPRDTSTALLAHLCKRRRYLVAYLEDEYGDINGAARCCTCTAL